MKIKTLAPLALAIALAGCATPYECPMGNQCLNVSEAYQAAKNGGGNHESVITQQEREAAQSSQLAQDGTGLQSGIGGTFGGQSSQWDPYAGGKLDDTPVYLPPRPLRIWIAPWVETADNGKSYLMAGQFMYATMGGGWSMGTMGEDGNVGGLMLSPYVPTPKNDKRVQPKQGLVAPADDSGGSHATAATFGQ